MFDQGRAEGSTCFPLLWEGTDGDFFPKILERIILNSYSPIRGRAMSAWEMRSGGVMTAAKTKMRRMAYFLCRANVLASMIPIFARRTKTTGNSKTRPKASKNLMVKERYSFMLGMGLMKSVAKPNRNLKPTGMATQY